MVLSAVEVCFVVEVVDVAFLVDEGSIVFVAAVVDGTDMVVLAEMNTILHRQNISQVSNRGLFSFATVNY